MRKRTISCWLLGMLIGAALIGFLTGCKDEAEDATSPELRAQGVELKILESSEGQGKLIGLSVQATGLDSQHNPIGPTVGPIVIPNPVFPVSVPLTLNEPPCRYQITATATLSQQPPQTASGILNICQSSSLSLRLDDFEPFSISRDPLSAPRSVIAGDPVEVTCATTFFSAPDGDIFPLSAMLSEVDGKTICGPFDFYAPLNGDFPDPYPASSPITERLFTCTVFDGRSMPQTFQKTVTRRHLSDVDTSISPTPTPQPLDMTTVVVDSGSGVDSPTCGKASQPCQTIFQGIRIASISRASHVRISVKSGTYYSSGIKVSGSLNKNLTFEAESNVTLLGASVTIHANTTVRIQNFTFSESYIHAKNARGTLILENNRFTSNLHTPIGSFHGNSNITLRGNTIDVAGSNLFSIITGGMVLIEHNTITTHDAMQTGSPALIFGRGSGMTILNGNTITIPAPGQTINCYSGTFVSNSNNTTNGNISGCGTRDMNCSTAQCSF